MAKERPIVEDGDAPGSTVYPERAPEIGDDPTPTEVDVTRALCWRVFELEQELERRERQHERVIARYEKLLAEARSNEEKTGVLAWLRSLR